MTRLSKNLTREEFTCKCKCGFDTVDWELVGVLQACVDHFQNLHQGATIKIHINSGDRCVEYNSTIPGASKTSQHLYARAADFYLYDHETKVPIPANHIADYLEDRYPDRYGIGRYSGRTHFDTRTGPAARWDRRNA